MEEVDGNENDWQLVKTRIPNKKEEKDFI